MPSGESKLIREPVSSINASFPGNSDTRQARPIQEREKLKPIVKGRVVKQKRGFLSKFKESICGNDQQSVMDYILFDILVPALKNTISDTVSGGLQMLLFGEGRYRNNNVRRDGARSYVSYNSYYNGNDDAGRRPVDRNIQKAREQHEFSDIVFASRGEAENVLSKMAETIDEYGLVSVADFYDLCGISNSFTDHRYGWTDLSTAFTEYTRAGYVIRLPRTKSLN